MIQQSLESGDNRQHKESDAIRLVITQMRNEMDHASAFLVPHAFERSKRNVSHLQTNTQRKKVRSHLSSTIKDRLHRNTYGLERFEYIRDKLHPALLLVKPKPKTANVRPFADVIDFIKSTRVGLACHVK